MPEKQGSKDDDKRIVQGGELALPPSTQHSQEGTIPDPQKYIPRIKALEQTLGNTRINLEN